MNHLNTLSAREQGGKICLAVSPVNDCVVMASAVGRKKMSIEQQKWVRNKLLNETSGGQSWHHTKAGIDIMLLSH
jgi:hypothetical protein